jgi:outer membrane protein OmpA-like peptidoglycan-associated protein
MIDFVGTAILPKGRGEASVDSKKGRTEIDASFKNLPEPNRFGREYLTYVLWALTPEGRPRNIGEIVPGSSDKAHLRVTTDLQAFALIVTAEPYGAVRQPGDVVVLENQVRPDTIGKIEEVDAKYELLPRGEYTWKGPNTQPNTPKVSMREYEALSELYQAQNAVGIAKAAGADHYAPNTFAKAEQLVQSAEQWQHNKGNTDRVVEDAREASQTAEDARMIAERRQREDQLVKDQARVNAAESAKEQAEQAAQQAQAQLQQAQAQADAERVARERAEAQAAAARDRAEQAEAQAAAVQSQPSRGVIARPRDNEGAKSEVRMRMLEQMNGALSTRDTPRGLIATIPDSEFAGATMKAGVSTELARLATVLSSRPGLRVEVEGNTDSEATAAECSQRADAVRNALIGRGLSPTVITAHGVGASRPVVSNSTPEGREQNRRVEIVVSGDAIGNLPFWDRTYSLTNR